MRRAALLLPVVVAAATLSVAGTSSGAQVEADAASLCKSKGIRYLGSTSQKKKLCFTLWTSGTRIAEYAYAFNDSCGSGTSRTTSKKGIPIAGGSFSTTGFGGSYFKGRLSGSTASGTFRVKQTQYGVVPPVSCDSGTIRWTARKAR